MARRRAGAAPLGALPAAGDTVYVGDSGGVGAVDDRTGRVLRWWDDAFKTDVGASYRT